MPRLRKQTRDVLNHDFPPQQQRQSKRKSKNPQQSQGVILLDSQETSDSENKSVTHVEHNVIPVEDNVIHVEDNVIPVEDNVIPVEDNVIPVEDNVIHLQDPSCDQCISGKNVCDESRTKAVQSCIGPMFERTVDVVLKLKSEDFISGVPEQRKTARRGLAKRNCLPPTVSNIQTTSSSHHVMVYSQAVAEGFKSLIHGSDSQRKDEATCTEPTVLNNIFGVDQVTSESLINLKEPPNESRVAALADSVMDLEELPVIIQSPSPPPQPSAKNRPIRISRQINSALKALNKAKMFLDKDKSPTPKRRILKRDSDVMFVGEETDTNKQIIVKVRHRTTVYRIPMSLTDQFHTLAKKLSALNGQSEHSLGLYLGERSLDMTETPQSVRLSVADIIECLCIQTGKDQAVSSTYTVQLVIRYKNRKSKITLSAHKRRPLSEVIDKYAQLIGEDSSSLVFSFDGDEVEPTDTPEKLEMEDDDVIDVIDL